jgi:hypothetical protein
VEKLKARFVLDWKGYPILFSKKTEIIFPRKLLKNSRFGKNGQKVRRNNREKIWWGMINVLSLQTLSGSKNPRGPGKRARGNKKRDL